MRIIVRERIATAAALLVASLILPGVACAATPSWRVGAAVETIDPTYPVYMGGYGGVAPGGTLLRHINPPTVSPRTSPSERSRSRAATM